MTRCCNRIGALTSSSVSPLLAVTVTQTVTATTTTTTEFQQKPTYAHTGRRLDSMHASRAKLINKRVPSFSLFRTITVTSTQYITTTISRKPKCPQPKCPSQQPCPTPPPCVLQPYFTGPAQLQREYHEESEDDKEHGT